MNIKATVLLPTTKGREALLPFSVGSILQQTVKEIEVFIIGDGVDQATRDVIHDLMRKDNRIRFFDHPKGERRGEIYRHQALRDHARGEIVCYLLDRDLMLPDHVERMHNNLNVYNLCVKMSLFIQESRKVEFVRKRFFGTYVDNSLPKPKSLLIGGFLFSQVGHTLQFYKQLPFGWRVTPSKWPTDVYMWLQFIQQENLKILSTSDATILYFKRGNHPGKPAAERAKELEHYYPMLNSKTKMQELYNEAVYHLLVERAKLHSDVLLIKGKPFYTVPLRIFTKLKRLFVKRW